MSVKLADSQRALRRAQRICVAFAGACAVFGTLAKPVHAQRETRRPAALADQKISQRDVAKKIYVCTPSGFSQKSRCRLRHRSS